MEHVIYSNSHTAVRGVVARPSIKPLPKLSLRIPSLVYKILFSAGFLFTILSLPFDVLRQLLLSDVLIFALTVFCAFQIYGNAKRENGYIQGYNDAVDESENQDSSSSS